MKRDTVDRERARLRQEVFSTWQTAYAFEVSQLLLTIVNRSCMRQRVTLNDVDNHHLNEVDINHSSVWATLYM